MKLKKILFSELNSDAQERVINDFSDSGFNPEYLTKIGAEYSKRILDAEIVTYEEDECILIDIRVFDPYSKIKTGDYSPVYIGWNGWSNWLYDYRDNQGHDVDAIFEDYDGESQD